MPDQTLAIAMQTSERIIRAQDMLGRLGARSAYEPNYATEKLADAARCALEACAILGMSEQAIRHLAGNAFDSGSHLRQQLTGGDRG